MLRGRRLAHLYVALVLGLWMSRAVGAQIGGGVLAGRIVDQAGSAVPGATVTVSNAGTNRSRTVVTGDDGVY